MYILLKINFTRNHFNDAFCRRVQKYEETDNKIWFVGMLREFLKLFSGNELINFTGHLCVRIQYQLIFKYQSQEVSIIVIFLFYETQILLSSVSSNGLKCSHNSQEVENIIFWII